MKLLLDSDFLVALYKPDDSNHQKATGLFATVSKNHTRIVLNLVIQESTTVISKRMGMTRAKAFYQGLSTIISQSTDLNQELEKISWRLFLNQTKKGTSFIDCANLAVFEYYKLNHILSFDTFYPKKVLFAP